jgi:hypothetical protein
VRLSAGAPQPLQTNVRRPTAAVSASPARLSWYRRRQQACDEPKQRSSPSASISKVTINRGLASPFVHSALAMTRRLKRRDRCPARLALGCPEVTRKADIVERRLLIASNRRCVEPLYPFRSPQDQKPAPQRAGADVMLRFWECICP